jgi:hypothetical protein
VGGGWVAARRLRSYAVIVEIVEVLLYSVLHVVLYAEELDGGGGSVRRRNTLHEVGGRSLNETRVLKARAGSETHTHLIFSLTPTYANKIKS